MANFAAPSFQLASVLGLLGVWLLMIGHSLDGLHGRRRPSALGNRRVGPVRADIEREIAGGCWQPVRLPLLGRWCCADIERQRSIRALLETLVLRAERVAI